MRHPSEGVLRRLVDEPDGVTVDERAHVAACPACLRSLESARADARRVDAALATSVAVDTDAAWGRLAATSPTGTPATVRSIGSGRSRWRTAVRRPVVAAVSAAVLVGGAGVAAANDWLPIFRTEAVDPVTVSSTDLVQVPDLSAYGDLAVTEVAELPEGVTGEPTYQVADVVQGTFTFSAEKAAQAAAVEGEALPPVP